MFLSYRTFLLDTFSFLGKDIDGETLFNLPHSMMYEIIKPMKERVRFMTEHRALFHDTSRNNDDQISSGKYTHSLLDDNSQPVIEENRIHQLTTQSTITFSNTHLDDASTFDGSTDSKVSKEEAISSSKEDVNKENDEHDEEFTFPYIYILYQIYHQKFNES
jgi:hypothetical protein